MNSIRFKIQKTTNGFVIVEMLSFKTKYFQVKPRPMAHIVTVLNFLSKSDVGPKFINDKKFCYSIPTTPLIHKTSKEKSHNTIIIILL